MSEKQRRRTLKNNSDADDDDDDEEVNEEEEEEEVEEKARKRKADPKTRLVSRKRVKNLIDDAAELSGSDASGDEEDEDESDEDALDYERDGFVVDEEASETHRDELEDSHSEPDSDSASDASSHSSKRLKRRRVKRLRDVAALDEDDLALIEESKHHSTEDLPEKLEPASHAPFTDHHQQQQQRQKTITATSEAELRKELFLESDDDDSNDIKTYNKASSSRVKATATQASSRRSKANTTFDEDGLDDFIDYQEDDDAYLDDDQRREAMEKRRLLYLNELQQDSTHRSSAGVTQAQLQEATDIFGDEYLDILSSRQRDILDDEDDLMDADTAFDRKHRTRKPAFRRERGVGVEYDLESSDEDLEYEEELLHSDDEEDLSQGSVYPSLANLTPQQQSEAKRLTREKKSLEKQERRRQAALQKAERRKARLRKAFEPVQLMHNFCTDKDDLIRSKDEPERFFDSNTPFHGPASKGQSISTAVSDTISEEEIEEALWIMGRIPPIASEFFNAMARDQISVKFEQDVAMELDSMSKTQKSILDSISYALRFLHREKLEPEFIRRYRADIVTSTAVRDHLYTIMDDDAEWDRFIIARNKVQQSLQFMTSLLEVDNAKETESEQLDECRENVRKAQERYYQSMEKETKIRLELRRITGHDDSMDQENIEDDLFGLEDQEGQLTIEDEEKIAFRKQKESLRAHLTTAETLTQVCAEQLEALSSSLQSLERSQLASGRDIYDVKRRSKKMSLNMLLNHLDYLQYLSTITEYRHVMDIYGYLSLLREGNEALFKKSSVHQQDSNIMESVIKIKRSKRFDRDLYRTCVSEGLRSVCYKFVLAPYRVGILLEEKITKSDKISWDLALPGEENGIVDPRNWTPPVVEDADPKLFAGDLIGSGELILLSSSTNAIDLDLEDHPELMDPLRGCRYVAATELAYEPRVRRYLRFIYRSLAVLSTAPTKKGLESIDAFHEFYGLHLIRQKPIKDHFPMDPKESEERKRLLNLDGRKALDEEIKNRERDSCVQYLNILKAERNGFIQVFIHLPWDNLQENSDVYWYEKDKFSSSIKKQNQENSPLMKALESIYLPPDGDMEEWNDQRRKVLRLTLSKFLLPHFEAEVKRDLLEASIRKGVQAAGKNMLAMAMEGPYRPNHMLSVNRFLVPTGDLPVIGFICANDGKEASFLAAVSERGEVNDYLGIPGSAQIDDANMREKVITFLMAKRPALIAVGTSIGLFSNIVRRKLSEMVGKATERWNNRGKQEPNEDDEDFQERMSLFRQTFSDCDDNVDSHWTCDVALVDDSVAQLFGRSVRGQKEFPDYALNLKCAISLARYAKDPLAELTYAWTVASDAGFFGTEILYLNVHPLQQILPKPLLLKEYNRTLCFAVAEVGVDLNASCQFDHLHGLLTFVPGFGPRKAASLRQSFERFGGVIASRRELLAKRLVGPIVYNNAVAFLRIRPIDALSTAALHPLDDTRLHPDVYQKHTWATKIAIDALELSDTAGDSNADKEDLGITALREIMRDSRKQVSRLFFDNKPTDSIDIPIYNASWDPRKVPNKNWHDKVEELDLEAFAELIERNRLGKWLSHLTMIKWEFRLPFADVRKPMEPLDQDDEKRFRLLTGETDLSLRPGKEVTARVLRNLDESSLVQLEGELQGYIWKNDLSDGHVVNPNDFVQPGQIVTAVVTKVKKEHLSVCLSLKLEDLRKLPSSWERPDSLPPFDLYFDRLAAETLEEEMSQERDRRLAAINVNLKKTKIGGDGNSGVDGANGTLRTGRVTRRACDHPAFRNATHVEVDRELKCGGLGDALIRPSSKQADALVLHWHIRLGIVKVMEITEEDKDNDTSIGRTLKIKNEVYGSIDELLSRYIMPMNERVQEFISHRKFSNLPEDDVDDKLKELKRATPSGIFYFFCWSEKHPDCASLRYMINSTRFHIVIIRPEGFTWCNRTFPNIDALLNEFKKNPQGSSSSVTGASSRSLNSSLASSSTTKAVAYSAGEASKPASRWGAKNVPAPPTTIPVYASVGASSSMSSWGQPNPQGVMLPPPPRAAPLPPLMSPQGYTLYPPTGAPPSGYPSYH